MIRFIFIFLCIAIAGLALAGFIFYQSDLSRAELGRYVDQHSRFIRLADGAEVHLRDQGDRDAPVVVLLHGGLGSLHNWDPWLATLEQQFRVIRLDLPGHGLTGAIPSQRYTRDSMVEFVRDTLAAEQITQFSLAGHSMGGGIALAYALAYPEQVTSLLLVASEGVPGEAGYDADELFVTEDGLAEADTDYTLSVTERILARFSSPWVVEYTLKQMVADESAITTDVVDEFGTILRHQGNRHAIALMFKQFPASIDMQVDLKPKLDQVSAPTLIMIGAEDTLVPVAVGEVFASGISGSELRIYDGVGHMIMLEAAQQSAEDALVFLIQHTAAGDT